MGSGEPAMSVLFVPLIVGGEATGRISLQNLDHEHAFSEADVRLLTTIAGSLSVALENARLFEETRQRNAELALINDVQRGLAENLEMQAMYDLVGDRLHEIFDAQIIDIGVLDREAALIHYPYTLERGVRLADEPTPLTAGPGAHVLETREPLVINERFQERSRQFGGGFVTGESPMSAVYVPLVVGGEATGRISLQNIDREHAFSEGDVRLLTTLAGSLSVALENARLFEETRQRNAELALINDVQRGLAENLEMQAMYDLVGERLAQIFDAQTVDIGVVDAAADQIWFPYSIERGVRLIDHPIEIMGFRKIAMETREPVVVNEDMERRCIEAGNPLAIAGEPSLSSVFVPLLIGNRGTGVISLHNLDREHAFSEADVRLLMTLAGSLSVGLENARLFEETGQRAAELAIINNVGQALAEQLELDALIERLGDQLREVFSADLVYVAFHDTATDMIDFAYYSENGERGENPSLRFGEGLTSRILQTRVPLLLNRPEAFEELGIPVVGNPGQVVPGGPHHRRHGCHRRDQRAAASSRPDDSDRGGYAAPVHDRRERRRRDPERSPLRRDRTPGERDGGARGAGTRDRRAARPRTDPAARSANAHASSSTPTRARSSWSAKAVSCRSWPSARLPSSSWRTRSCPVRGSSGTSRSAARRRSSTTCSTTSEGCRSPVPRRRRRSD